MTKKAIIIGAGPAGLTAAYELLKRTDIKPIILEKSGDIGGISKTINYKGNRMDIGGHRFFSKSDRVMKWWLNIMPIQQTDNSYTTITYQRKHHTIVQEETPSRTNTDDTKVMLIRKRLSRIYFLRKFFTYPIQLSLDTLQKLGLIRTTKILVSYLYAQIVPRKPEESLEDFMINRFGRQLYLLFFKDYTEKVWGVPCKEISAEWGAQRIKGISISRAIQHAAKLLVQKKRGTGDISQKGTETSLIEQFLYPALGPGQLWEEVARQIVDMGGEIHFHQDVKQINIGNTNEEVPVFAEQEHLSGGSISDSQPMFKNHKQQNANRKLLHSVTTIDSITEESFVYEGDYFFSTMPVQELIAGMNDEVPEDVKEAAAGLQYRDFITVGVLLQRLSSTDINTGETKTLDLKDTWIYIQEKDVKVGRLQLFNNWSPYMVNKPGTVWVGMEYFCNKGDGFWSLSDEEIQRTAIEELEKMGLAQVQDVLDSTIHRVEKTYPAYFGTYNEFDKIRAYVDELENLFLVGRNGMHKYNNSDHSMLTAMTAVDNICAGITTKENIWSINTEQEYHEEKKEGVPAPKEPVYNIRENKKPEPEPVLSFREFLFRNTFNKRMLWFSAIAIVIQFVIFKYMYPFASFINGDSYSYLEAAADNLSINIYPVGYSNFLRLFSVFTKSDTALVGFQYLLLHISILGFLFSVFYFYKPGKVVHIFLLVFLILNPVFLYLANYVSSDTLFISLSLIWFTLLLWIMHRPSTKLIIWHGLVLFLAFTVRYNAMFYPLIAGLAFFLSKQRLWTKIAGLAFGLLLIGLFVLHTGNEYKKLTGTWQFSPFSGWQLANNTIYLYSYIDKTHRYPIPPRLSGIDKMVTTFFDTTKDLNRFSKEKIMASTMFMWTPGMPLQKYMNEHFKNDTAATIKLKRWATFGPLYSEYGSYLIRKYPVTFLKYYMWPNAIKFYAPPVEFLEQYSTGRDIVNSIAQKWFGYKTRKITSRFKDFDVHILDFLPILAGMLHIVFLFGLMGYLLFQGYQKQPWLNEPVLLVSSYWLLNFGFSVFASPIALRFQLFPIIVSISFACLFVEYIVKTARQHEIKHLPTEIESIQFSG